MSAAVKGSDIERMYIDAGHEWTHTSHFDDGDFTIVLDRGVGEGRYSVQCEIQAYDDAGILEVEMTYRAECCHFGDEWVEYFEGTAEELVHACGRAIMEDGERPE